jgi:glycerol-3-phosphate O-acyltransferase/dihydroxyacetone phosphate acyltransferase
LIFEYYHFFLTFVPFKFEKQTNLILIYSFVRPIAAYALKIFFRKIYFTNRERLPKGKPLILAINHPTAFIEPCILACFLPIKLYFLVRGDLFKKPFFRKILNVLHMVPIFRRQEGLDQLKKNGETFDFCYEALKDHKTVVILPEGRTIQEKRLRPIRKGLARIAFGTYEKYGDIDLHIVPIGVNFTQADEFRSVAMFDVGEPIRLRDYYDQYQENPQRASRSLTKRVKEGLENHIVNIPNPADDALAEDLFTLFRNDHPEKNFPIISEDRQLLEGEMKIADQVSQMSAEEKSTWSEKIKQYFSKLKSKGVDDQALQNAEIYNWKNTLFLVLGFVPYFLGYWFNYPIFGYAKYVSKTKVKQLEFKAPVALAVGLGLSVLLVLFLVSVGIYLWGWWSILALLFLFYLGRFSLVYLEFWEKYNAAKAVKNLDKITLEELRNERFSVSSFQ